MNKQQPQQKSQPSRLLKKLSLSAFVVMTFAAYAMHKPANSTDGSLSMIPPTPSGVTPQSPTAEPATAVPTETTAAATATQQEAAPTMTANLPTAVPPTAVPPTTAPVPTAASGYQDGTYTGPEVDAIYGLVQVQTVIQQGKIVNVQFLKYPADRRTSQRINNYAMPYLQQEAIQAQSSNVDLISGATLTSEAFQQSLQAALNKAKGGA